MAAPTSKIGKRNRFSLGLNAKPKRINISTKLFEKPAIFATLTIS